MRGSASSHRVTPACMVRIPWVRTSLKSGSVGFVLADSQIDHLERHEGEVTSRDEARYQGGKTSESKSPRALLA